MPSRLRRLALLVPLLAVTGLASVAAPPPSAAASGYSRDLFFAAGYERQVDNRTCVAASVAMMMNFIAGRDLNLYQPAILRWAQARDALSNSIQRGSDPLGWSRAATYFSTMTGKPTSYVWESWASEYRALKRAASMIAAFGKPVGLLVQHGQHAVVMTGFISDRDPRRGDFTLRSVVISDPLGSAHYVVGAASSPLNTYRETDATPTYDRYWYGYHVIVGPLN